MGREVKRVPLDFHWPLHQVWSGYVMPDALHLTACPACDGDGYSVEARAIAETFYPHQIGGPHADALAWHDKIGQAEVNHLVAEGRLSTLRHREPTSDNPRDWEWVSLPRTAADINTENSRGGMSGHDAINRSILVAFRCERLGIPMECHRCEGHGDIAPPTVRAAREAWEQTEPPAGECYQVWETVSEGSPISPVFGDTETMVAWLIAEGYSEDAARAFGRDGGWVPSMMMSGGQLYRDVESATLQKR